MKSCDTNNPPLFFYDAECGICDATISFFLNHSEPHRLHFAPLQSEYAKAILAGNGIVDPDIKAAYFCDQGAVVSKSSAILGGLSCCWSPYRWMTVFRVIPPFIRDFGYDFVARNRYRISRLSKTQCRVLKPEERPRFYTGI
ncbi:DCC1-like thiol-disulfide oxidoreductase family protein [Verrucomicrobia bacterium]|nr:DCC1-like thiol-disulfide oxidoreductase family protein [Verrucomicrobiota bacterium]